MEDNKFKQVEKTLYRYYEDQKELEIISKVIDNLNIQYEELEEMLRSNKIKVVADIGSPGFEERVQISSDGTSKVESEMIKVAEEMLKEQQFIMRDIFKQEAKKRALIRNSLKIKLNLENMPDDYKLFLELKYKEKKDITVIIDTLNISRAAGFNLRSKIIDEISRWIEIIE